VGEKEGGREELVACLWKVASTGQVLIRKTIARKRDAA
jgi:hypothetical protein